MRTFRRFLSCAALALCLTGAAVPSRGAVFIVRHAEKQSDSNDREVPLSEAGKARARRLAEILRDAKIAAIYSTDFVRTLATAEPLAQANGQKVILYAPNGADGKVDMAPLVGRIRAEHAADNVLVVGHSNTVGPLIQALGCRDDVSVAGGEYDGLWIVVPASGHGGSPTLLRLRQ
jgi:broad specificity phosphatase PhoE